MNRRNFLGGLMALGCQGLWLGKANAALPIGLEAEKHDKHKKSGKGKFDENMVVLISDLHTNPDGYQPDRLRKVIADILALRPLPANIIAMGDLAYLTGKPNEYAALKEIIAPIEQAGIKLTMAMGNHDRRENFAAAFPSYAAKSLMKERMVFRVETPHADFLVIDSLHQGDDETTWITEGVVDDAQRAFITKLMMSATKPLFLCTHHDLNETLVGNLMLTSPTCCGYIFGHHHIWNTNVIIQNYAVRNCVRTMCLPSTGHWGDIGYVKMYLEDDHARAELVQSEYFFPNPGKEGEPKPLHWRKIVEDHQGIQCSFVYKKCE